MSTFDIGDRPFPAIIHVRSGDRLRRYVPERTCRMDLTESSDDGYEMPYRTWECEECGRYHEEIYGAYEYCPHCGAKVVAE